MKTVEDTDVYGVTDLMLYNYTVHYVAFTEYIFRRMGQYTYLSYK